MGALLAILAAKATFAAKRAASVYGILAVGAVIAVFACAYALNAGYTALMFRHGAAAASLMIAGGLVVLAVAAAVAAQRVGAVSSRAKDETDSRRVS